MVTLITNKEKQLTTVIARNPMPYINMVEKRRNMVFM